MISQVHVEMLSKERDEKYKEVIRWMYPMIPKEKLMDKPGYPTKEWETYRDVVYEAHK